MKPGDLVKIKEDYLLMGEETVGLVIESYLSSCFVRKSLRW